MALALGTGGTKGRGNQASASRVKQLQRVVRKSPKNQHDWPESTSRSYKVCRKADHVGKESAARKKGQESISLQDKPSDG